MSSLLTLGQDLEQKSKEQRERTAVMLKAAFSEHEASVKAELSASGKKISDAISAHERTLASSLERSTKGMLNTIGRTWLIIVAVSVLLLGTCGGILHWQSQQIRDNYVQLREQEDALAKLNAKTWGVSFQSNSQGHFLMLPEGMKAEPGWTFDGGRKQGIKLVRE